MLSLMSRMLYFLLSHSVLLSHPTLFPHSLDLRPFSSIVLSSARSFSFLLLSVSFPCKQPSKNEHMQKQKKPPQNEKKKAVRHTPRSSKISVTFTHKRPTLCCLSLLPYLPRRSQPPELSSNTPPHDSFSSTRRHSPASLPPSLPPSPPPLGGREHSLVLGVRRLKAVRGGGGETTKICVDCYASGNPPRYSGRDFSPVYFPQQICIDLYKYKNKYIFLITKRQGCGMVWWGCGKCVLSSKRGSDNGANISQGASLCQAPLPHACQKGEKMKKRFPPF